MKPKPPSTRRLSWIRSLFRSRAVLLIAFAFAVMGDPVSSVAYAIEAALRELHGNLGLLLPTMSLVVAIIGLVILNYHQLVGRFPEGGGGPAAVGAAFGEGWAFVPIGALIVDFVLTISISVAAGASAVIAYIPALAGWRVLMALVLVCAVGGLTWFGHGGRAIFAVMTLAFIAIAALMLWQGWLGGHSGGATQVAGRTGTAPITAIIFAFPVAMALATGIEAPSSAIAQLDQLDNRGRRRFGRITLWLTLGIVGGLTLAITALAVHLRVGIPPPNSTQVAELARVAGTRGVFVAFQGATAVLLLAAASSSFQAGPGLFKALARRQVEGGREAGILPGWMSVRNRYHTPYWSVALFVVGSAAVVLAAGGQDQILVLYYAVAVFIAFLSGLVAMARFSFTDHAWGALATNVLGTLVVAFTLTVNLTRLYPLASFGAAVLIGGLLFGLWVRAGRPRGIAGALAASEG